MLGRWRTWCGWPKPLSFPGEGTRLSASRISIIDDDESTRLALAGLVRFFGFEPKTYGSAEEFLASDAGEQPCCIISDIHMPGLSGLELKRWLDDHDRAAPVILITARSEPHVLAQADASGAVCLLRKPFDAAALLASLKKARVA
jgi:FixJ family two-component response regulator